MAEENSGLQETRLEVGRGCLNLVGVIEKSLRRLVTGEDSWGGGGGKSAVAFTGGNRQGVGQASLAVIGVGLAVDLGTDRFVEVRAGGFRRSSRLGSGDGDYCRRGSDGGGPAADVQNTAFGEENDRTDEGEENENDRQSRQKRIGR